MKNLLLLLGISLFAVAFSFAQEAKVKTNKLEYKFDEVIELSFELNATFDSITGIDLNKFEPYYSIIMDIGLKNSIWTVNVLLKLLGAKHSNLIKKIKIK